MAEYIDREKVCENCNNKNYCEKEKCPVYKVSTADVVPKSEVEKLQAEAENLRNANADLALALLYECEPTKEHLSELEKTVREKLAREIFEEIEKIATAEGAYDYVSIQDIAELKKKYTESENG